MKRLYKNFFFSFCSNYCNLKFVFRAKFVCRLKMISIQMCKFTVLLLLSSFTLIKTKAQTDELNTDTQTDILIKSPSLHPIVDVFNPHELSVMRSSNAITFTPLKYEEKIAKSWLMGRNDAMKMLAESATSEGINIDSILNRNNEKKMSMTPEQLQQQAEWAYQLGGLHAINKLRKYAKLSLSSIEESTPEELYRLRMKQRQFVRALRGDSDTFKHQVQFGIQSNDAKEKDEFETNVFGGMVNWNWLPYMMMQNNPVDPQTFTWMALIGTMGKGF